MIDNKSAKSALLQRRKAMVRNTYYGAKHYSLSGCVVFIVSVLSKCALSRCDKLCTLPTLNYKHILPLCLARTHAFDKHVSARRRWLMTPSVFCVEFLHRLVDLATVAVQLEVLKREQVKTITSINQTFQRITYFVVVKFNHLLSNFSGGAAGCTSM